MLNTPLAYVALYVTSSSTENLKRFSFSLTFSFHDTLNTQKDKSRESVGKMGLYINETADYVFKMEYLTCT